jgi:excisionase family DNA binding protein
MTVEVTVTNPAYWSDRAPQLAEMLRSAGEGGGPSTVGDPTGVPADPDRLLMISDPGYWSERPAELSEMLFFAAWAYRGTENAVPAEPGSGGQERLTMTVEEAAAALGISRAFAYEAVTRNEIPHVRIGRRILVPRAALERMLGSAGGPD